MGMAFGIIMKMGALMLALYILKYFCQHFITAWGHIMGAKFDISELAHHGPEEVFISLIKIIGSFFILLSIDVKLTPRS